MQHFLFQEPISKHFDLKNETIKTNKQNNDKNTNDNDIIDKIVDDANKYFLVKILSPEITNNEEKKRVHKDNLISLVKIFLLFQFSILAILVVGFIVMIFVFHGLHNDLDLTYIKTIIKFISLYITSIIVELIAMLKFIVTNVFDTSITGLVEIYKDTINNKFKKLD